MGNGKVLVTAIAIFVAIMTTGVSYVVANDVGSRARDEKLGDRLTTVEIAVTRIDTSLGALNENYKEQRVENKESFKELTQLIKEIKG